GPHSEAGRLAAAGKHELAEQWLADWQRHTGERLHLELVRTGREGEQAFNAFALHAASARGIPVVASNDVRFLDRDGFEAHEARVCIASGRVLDDPRRPRDYTAEQYLKSGDEMAALFADVPDAVDNAIALATRCNLELSLGTYFLPAFPVPSGETLDSWIRARAREGLERRLARHPLAPGKTRADYDARLESELDVIVGMGFPGYFLIVADFINWAKDHDIPVGPGRGSGAGSLVAWALGITDLDPLPYDLLFERFLNPERVSMPDFDVDFCMARRDEVIDYVAGKYGKQSVGQIATFQNLKARSVIKDVARTMGFPAPDAQRIASLVPDLGQGKTATVAQALEQEQKLKQMADSDPRVAELLKQSQKLEGLTRHAGMHAAGVVISEGPLHAHVPCFTSDAAIVTQYDKDDVEEAGLVKFDFLGLKTLTVIDIAERLVNARPDRAGRPLDLSKAPLDDRDTYALISSGDTTGVFQLESSGMQQLLRQLKPDCFEDIVAAVALYRPGPLGTGMIDDF